MNDYRDATTPSSTTPAVFTPDDIERIEKSISTAPVPARPMTTADALQALAPTLTKARGRGHSLTSLVQLCVQQGLQVNERAVSRAISMARASKAAKRKQATSAA